MYRMFEAPAQSSRGRRSSVLPGQLAPPAPPAVPQAALTGPRPSNATHGRRSSIQKLPGTASPGRGDGEGNDSVDMSMESIDDGNDHAEAENATYPAQHDDNESNDGEGEMSMDETIHRGGIISRQQFTYTGDESYISESEANTSTRSDEERTMDFTHALGGVLPTAPPANATRGRASVGYRHGSLADGEAIIPGEGEDDMDMEMDETVAFGGIINLGPGHGLGHGQDDTISTASGSEDTMTMNRVSEGRTGTFSFNNVDLQVAARLEQSATGRDTTIGVDMDITTVSGGIFSQQYQQHQAALSLSRSQSQAPASAQAPVASTTPKSPRAITRPLDDTPSFARATTSSASKIVSLQKSPEKKASQPKRNIFGPSPSPFKGSSTPRKSGMQTAGEVAKRLSFGSAAGSASKKRAREDYLEEAGGEKENEAESGRPASAKKQRLSVPTALGLGESVFGSNSRTSMNAISPVLISSPIRAPPVALVSHTATPSRSPAVRRAMGVTTPVVEEEVDDVNEDINAHGEPRTIGLGAFLTMAGVQFDDAALSGPRRRASVAKGLLGRSQSRSFR